MSTTHPDLATSTANLTDGFLISADSHVSEDHDFWRNGLPAAMRERVPQLRPRGEAAPRSAGTLDKNRPGGYDPAERVNEMTQDGVSAEVLYPTHGLRLFSLDLSASRPPSDEQVARFLAIVSQPENQPVLVHCRNGVDRTGYMLGIYRIEKGGWSPERAVREMNRYLQFEPLNTVPQQVVRDGLRAR